MSKNFLFSVLLSLAAVFTTACQPANAADTVSFNNVTLTYQSTDLSIDKSDGAAFAFSKTLGDVLFVSGNVSRSDNTRSDLDTYRLGLGAKFDFANNANLYVLGYGLRANLDYSNPAITNFDSYGYGAEGGVRVKAFSSLELRGGVATERLTQNSAWETYGLVGATLNLTDSIAVVGDARIRNNRNQYNVGLQYQF